MWQLALSVAVLIQINRLSQDGSLNLLKKLAMLWVAWSIFRLVGKALGG